MKETRTWLQKRRQRLNKTQQDVANKAGIERAYYTMLENGTRSPSPAVAKRIAVVLDFDWTVFFAEECSDMTHERGKEAV